MQTKTDSPCCVTTSHSQLNYLPLSDFLLQYYLQNFIFMFSLNLNLAWLMYLYTTKYCNFQNCCLQVPPYQQYICLFVKFFTNFFSLSILNTSQSVYSNILTNMCYIFIQDFKMDKITYNMILFAFVSVTESSNMSKIIVKQNIINQYPNLYNLK